MLGLAAPAKPPAPISKADVPFERIRAIAKTMQSAGRARTIEPAIALAASENAEIYAEYRAAFDEEARERALQSGPLD